MLITSEEIIMQYRYLGTTGLQVSSISLGSYLTFGHSVDVQMAEKLMHIAYEANVNLFDNAEVYALGRSEEIMGTVLKKLQWPRDTYIVMTKIFWGGPKPTQCGLHRKHIIESCNTSLKRLNTEYIDLFLCHRPDHKTPIEETVRSMHQLIQQGKILYWGTSEWSASQIMEAILIAQRYNLTPPSLEQFQYNMMERQKIEKDLTNLLQKNIGVVTTMPLAGGLLTGKYNKNTPENSRFFRLQNVEPELKNINKQMHLVEKIERLSDIARNNKMTIAQLAIAWCLKNNTLSSVIIGSSNEEQLKENLQSLNYIEQLDENTMESIDSILENKPNKLNESYDYQMVIERV